MVEQLHRAVERAITRWFSPQDVHLRTKTAIDAQSLNFDVCAAQRIFLTTFEHARKPPKTPLFVPLQRVIAGLTGLALSSDQSARR